MSPQVLQKGRVSKAADVYSFAMLMLELWTGDIIYRGIMYHQVKGGCLIWPCPLTSSTAASCTTRCGRVA